MKTTREERDYMRRAGFVATGDGSFLRRGGQPPGRGLYHYLMPVEGGWLARRGQWRSAALQPDPVTALVAAEVDNWGL